MKAVLVALFAVISAASAQKFFFSDAATAPAGVPAVPSVPIVPGAPLVPGVPGGPLVPGLPGFPAPAAPAEFVSSPFSSLTVPAAPAVPLASPNKYIPIVEHTQVKNPDGSYNLRYETANGIAQNEASSVTINHKGEAIVARTGSYGYTAPDGTPVSISYIADEHGFRVSGNPLPVAPQALPVAPVF